MASKPSKNLGGTGDDPSRMGSGPSQGVSSPHQWRTFTYTWLYGGTKCERCGRYSDWAFVGLGHFCWPDVLGRWFKRFRCVA